MIFRLLASIGVIALCIVAVILYEIIILAINDAIDNYKYKKRLKTRFKGGPTAKCFCKDCKFYNETRKPDKYNHGTGDCRTHSGWTVSDAWYCWSATPIDHNEAKRRNRE